MTVVANIYRSLKKQGLYLYVKKGQELSELPDSLVKQFGKPEFSMTLILREDRTLARANAKEVIAALESQKFYLQMPPPDFKSEI